MIDFAAILKANPSGVFASSDGNKVKTRVFGHLFTEGNKVYFSTNNEKAVYKQMQANPNVSFCTYTQDFNPVLSVNGKAVFVEDMALKQRAFEASPALKSIYNSPENPIFKIFYIDVEEVVTFTFAEGTKTYKV